MSTTDRLWLNGFTTASELLHNDRLAIEEVREALEEDVDAGESWLVRPVPRDRLAAEKTWMAPWRAGLQAGIRACFGE
jgi:hypothetical protein